MTELKSASALQLIQTAHSHAKKKFASKASPLSHRSSLLYYTKY